MTMLPIINYTDRIHNQHRGEDQVTEGKSLSAIHTKMMVSTTTRCHSIADGSVILIGFRLGVIMTHEYRYRPAVIVNVRYFI